MMFISTLSLVWFLSLPEGDRVIDPGNTVSRDSRSRQASTAPFVAFTIPERDLIPEGIAYDPFTRSFFVGSIYRSKIIRIDNSGNVSDFITEGQDSLGSVAGVRVDPDRRMLWAAHIGPIYIPGKGRTDPKIRTTGLFKFDMRSRKLVKKYIPKMEQGRFFNDVVVSSREEVFATETRLGAIYRIDPQIDALVPFLQSNVLKGANGICFSPDEKFLFVATDTGIVRVDVKSKYFELVGAADSLETGGIDGLYFYNNSLIAVQNGIQPVPIHRFELGPGLEKITRRLLLAQNEPDMLPTTGAIAGEWFYYIANAQLGSFTPEGRIFPRDKLLDVQIRRVRLD